jgi:hypothetical protein
MPVPTSEEVFTYGPVDIPVMSADPAAAKPLGVGPVSAGGDLLDIKVMAQFSGPVDVSVGIYAPAVDEMDIFFLDPEKNLKRLSKMIIKAGDLKTYSKMYRKYYKKDGHDEGDLSKDEIKRLLFWKRGVTEINETLASIPASELPSGVYSLMLTVKPSDEDYSFGRKDSDDFDDDEEDDDDDEDDDEDDDDEDGDDERSESEDGSYRWMTQFVIQ